MTSKSRTPVAVEDNANPEWTKADFAGGMDLSAFAGLKAQGAAGIFAGAMAIHALLRRTAPTY